MICTSYVASKWLLQDSTPGTVVLKFMPLIIKLYHLLMQKQDQWFQHNNPGKHKDYNRNSTLGHSGHPVRVREGTDLGSDVGHLMLFMIFNIINSRDEDLLELHGTSHKTPSESQKYKRVETVPECGSILNLKSTFIPIICASWKVPTLWWGQGVNYNPYLANKKTSTQR